MCAGNLFAVWMRGHLSVQGKSFPLRQSAFTDLRNNKKLYFDFVETSKP